MPEKKRLLAIIGGTAQIHPENIERKLEGNTGTPFGPASAMPEIWTFPDGNRALFLNRHGKFHQHNPGAINYPANFWLLKNLGVTDVVAVSAVGSLREDIAPGITMCVPDQIHDLTHRTQRTFFEDIAVHVSFGQPFCDHLRSVCNLAVGNHAQSSITHGNYVCIEGPQFSTRAESVFMKEMLNGSVVGMTSATEARLAREAGLCFATIALPADYDSWKAERACVDADQIKATLKNFEARVILTITELVRIFYAAEREPCDCADSLSGMAVHTRLGQHLEHLSPFERREFDRKYDIFGFIK
jgi:5'-methylthioadenosine phosphorylase